MYLLSDTSEVEKKVIAQTVSWGIGYMTVKEFPREKEARAATPEGLAWGRAESHPNS